MIVKNTIFASAAAALVAPAAGAAAADQFSVSTAKPAYKADISYQNRDNFRSWRGKDGRTYCRRRNGTTGLVIGAAGGALLGGKIDKGKRRCR